MFCAYCLSWVLLQHRNAVSIADHMFHFCGWCSTLWHILATSNWPALGVFSSMRACFSYLDSLSFILKGKAFSASTKFRFILFLFFIVPSDFYVCDCCFVWWFEYDCVEVDPQESVTRESVFLWLIVKANVVSLIKVNNYIPFATITSDCESDPSLCFSYPLWSTNTFVLVLCRQKTTHLQPKENVLLACCFIISA